MIKFNKLILDNGLTLLHYQDSATKMVALNLLYNVGSKDENPNCTGLAHLMEHLMFTGSEHVRCFDEALQAGGGVSNAWTNVDVTNYYETLPAHNIETALWCESDRLLDLSLSDESINIQKDVVIEEFKQRCLNEPYGDISHIIHDNAYTCHPYKWPTIGKIVEHIRDVTPDEIRQFYHRYYSVDNLIMCVAGNIDFETTVRLVNKWFGDIAPSNSPKRNLPVEPVQTTPRIIQVERNVPRNMLCKVFHMPARNDAHYPTCDLLSDIMANGKSSRFYTNVLSKSRLFNELDAAVEGTLEPGLFIIRAILDDNTSFEEANDVIMQQLNLITQEGVSKYELEKCVNKFHANKLFDNIGYQEKATKLCECELIRDANYINEELDLYKAVTVDEMISTATSLFSPNNSTTIYYKSK